MNQSSVPSIKQSGSLCKSRTLQVSNLFRYSIKFENSLPFGTCGNLINSWLVNILDKNIGRFVFWGSALDTSQYFSRIIVDVILWIKKLIQPDRANNVQSIFCQRKKVNIEHQNCFWYFAVSALILSGFQIFIKAIFFHFFSSKI